MRNHSLNLWAGTFVGLLLLAGGSASAIEVHGTCTRQGLPAQQDVSCNFNCVGGDQLTVSVSSSSQGTVSGDASCGQAVAACSGSDPAPWHCDGRSPGLVEFNSNNGFCHGHSSATLETGLNIECIAFLPGSAEGSSARISVVRGVVAGSVCNGGVCVPAEPACVLGPRGLDCWLGLAA